ncbi:unnamed protein product, partial [Pleuronectes platessa]
ALREREEGTQEAVDEPGASAEMDLSLKWCRSRRNVTEDQHTAESRLRQQDDRETRERILTSGTGPLSETRKGGEQVQTLPLPPQTAIGSSKVSDYPMGGLIELEAVLIVSLEEKEAEGRQGGAEQQSCQAGERGHSNFCYSNTECYGIGSNASGNRAR